MYTYIKVLYIMPASPACMLLTCPYFLKISNCQTLGRKNKHEF